VYIFSDLHERSEKRVSFNVLLFILLNVHIFSLASALN